MKKDTVSTFSLISSLGLVLIIILFYIQFNTTNQNFENQIDSLETDLIVLTSRQHNDNLALEKSLSNLYESQGQNWSSDFVAHINDSEVIRFEYPEPTGRVETDSMPDSRIFNGYYTKAYNIWYGLDEHELTDPLQKAYDDCLANAGTYETYSGHVFCKQIVIDSETDLQMNYSLAASDHYFTFYFLARTAAACYNTDEYPECRAEYIDPMYPIIDTVLSTVDFETR